MARIGFEGVVNWRDVGGHPTASGDRVRTGLLFRSETPQLMTPADVRAAVEDLGVRRVVDLRGERGGGSGPLGDDGRGVVIDFFGLSGGHGPPMDMSAAGFLPGQLDRAGNVIGHVLLEVVATDGAALVHCHTGKDRTGFVVAIILASLGVSDEDIVADYMASSPVFEAMMANLDNAGMGVPETAPDYAAHAPSPVGVVELLARLRADWASPAAYLEANGVEPDLIASARTKLLTPEIH